MFAVRLSELKNQPSSTVAERLRQAAAEGVEVLDVLSHGRPICHLALAEDLPTEWRLTEPATVALSELKRSEISITKLRYEGRALYLSQRSGPTLALWPAQGADTRPADLSLPEEVAHLRRELSTLRARVERLEERERALGSIAAITAQVLGANRPKAKAPAEPEKPRKRGSS